MSNVQETHRAQTVVINEFSRKIEFTESTNSDDFAIRIFSIALHDTFLRMQFGTGFLLAGLI